MEGLDEPGTLEQVNDWTVWLSDRYPPAEKKAFARGYERGAMAERKLHLDPEGESLAARLACTIAALEGECARLSSLHCDFGEDRPCLHEATHDQLGFRFCSWHKQRAYVAIRNDLRRDAETRDTVRLILGEFDAEDRAAHQEVVAASREDLVYFGIRDGFCKIGHSVNVPGRIRDISRGAQMIEGMTVGPVLLTATTPGGERTEQIFHRKFHHLRVAGEWFLLDDDLRAFIRGLKGYIPGALD